MPDPRRFDLVVRSVTTAAIAFGITLLAAYQAIKQGTITPELGAWGGVIIGFYFGSHSALNGSGVRAARDAQITQQLLNAAPPPATPPPPPAAPEPPAPPLP